MTTKSRTLLAMVLEKYDNDLLEAWVKAQKSATTHTLSAVKDKDLHEQTRDFIQELLKATQAGEIDDIQQQQWAGMRQLLAELSRMRAFLGVSPTETAMFVLSFKQPLFHALRAELAGSPEQLADVLWSSTLLIDRLGLYTTEVSQKAREEVISRQQQEMIELSTPVVQLWKGVLALPIIGTLDSVRSQSVMESLLQRIVDTEAQIAIIDITGVPTVDTLTAQHLLKTVTATRLMGAECIISGIRPQIAQTIVHLGVDLGDVITKSSLEGAFALALQRLQLTITRKTYGAVAQP